MTREEAIAFFKDMNECTYGNLEAVEMAIKALEQEPTTKNDLGVDREQLKTMIRGLTKWYVKRDNTEVGEPNTAVGLLYDDVMFGIDRLPSVTPQGPRIIICKDCKYYRNKGNKYSYCTKRLNVDSVTDRYREPNFYCADAVLREVEE